MSSTKKVHVTIVTPARTLLDADAAYVVVPAFDGEWALLPGHTAFLALLGTGVLSVVRLDGARQCLAVQGGFVQTEKDAVTVLTPEAAAPEELDAAALNEEITSLKTAKPPRDQCEAHRARLAWALARQKALASGPRP